MSQILEAIMVIAFGCSWPFAVIKSYKARTTQGKSIVQIMLLDFGYVCGILSKIVSGNITYVFIFYVINFFLVLTDIIIYFRNRRLDKQRELGLLTDELSEDFEKTSTKNI